MTTLAVGSRGMGGTLGGEVSRVVGGEAWRFPLTSGDVVACAVPVILMLALVLMV